MTTRSNAPDGPVTVRFAPSPTGQPHVGAMRTALFDWLLARRTGGTFIVRIEDTDQTRLEEGSIEAILDGLRWLGLHWDEGPEVGGPHEPYVQSQRRDLYQRAAQSLVESGAAYECDCSPERLEQVRERQRAKSEPPGYDGHCRDKSPGQRAEARAAGRPVVVRMRVPDSGEVSVHDYIRGDISFEWSRLSDFVILKSDGLPTYHLAHLVDDHKMGITHVLRGEEWIASAPRHKLIYDALGWEPPVFVHLPLLLGRDRSKLSKRHGAASILEYRDAGYLPEAVLNFLSLLGWSPRDDTEVMPRDEIVSRFSLDSLNESPAVFDPEKLQWMNGVYIRNMPADDLAERLLPVLDRDLPASVERPLDPDYVHRLTPLIHERLKLLTEAPDLLEFFYVEPPTPTSEDLIQRRMDSSSTASALRAALEVIESFEPFEPDPLEAEFRALAERLSLKPGQLFGSLRAALTGRRVAPPLFDTMSALGRPRSTTRVTNAIAALE